MKERLEKLATVRKKPSQKCEKKFGQVVGRVKPKKLPQLRGGGVIPPNTFARESVRKVWKKEKKGLETEEFFEKDR